MEDMLHGAWVCCICPHKCDESCPRGLGEGLSCNNAVLQAQLQAAYNTPQSKATATLGMGYQGGVSEVLHSCGSDTITLGRAPGLKVGEAIRVIGV